MRTKGDELSRSWQNWGWLVAAVEPMACGAAAPHPAGSLLVIETSGRLDSSPAAHASPPNFRQDILIHGLASVNGRRVKGTVAVTCSRQDRDTGAGITRPAMTEWYIEILHEDGQPIGSIRVSGANQGKTAKTGDTRA